jgi:hypothetical protein
MIAVINNTRKKKKKTPHSNQILSSIIELLISANRVHRNLEKKNLKYLRSQDRLRNEEIQEKSLKKS